MKVLTLSALLCVLALTKATDLSEPKDAHEQVQEIQKEENLVEKRWFCRCSHGWKYYKGRCFRYVAKRLTWAQAEKNCQSMGANLASVHGTQEYFFIQRMIKCRTHGYPQTWLGGSDSAENTVWFWSDGTRFRFTYWCRGEPSNTLNQHCLQMNYSGSKCWDDVQCYHRLPSVCAKRIRRFRG